MPHQLIKRMRGLDSRQTTADGMLYNDFGAVSELQDECTKRLTAAVQLEEVAYMINHPEILAMMKMFVELQVQHKRRKNIPELAGYFFTRPIEEIDKCVRAFLNLQPDEPYTATQSPIYSNDLEADLRKIIEKHNPMKLDLRPSPGPGTPLTASSSFLSELSSATTLPTPEPVPIPEPTTAEIFLKMIENALDKATFSKVTDNMVRYDTAYVELMKAVERAMEIPVIEIRIDIADLIEQTLNLFNSIIDEKERIAAEIAWEKRMRKKYKRTLRRQKNFKGYETPPTPKSGEPSSHSSYKIPPQRPCKCHPQWTYNRYPKDRFGIYIPSENEYQTTNITVTPEGSYLEVPVVDT